MQTVPKKYVPFIAGGAIIVLALVIWMLSSGTTLFQEGIIAGNEPVASTTDPVVGTTTQILPPAPAPKKKGLPPEPVFVLPEGAITLDEYAFIDGGAVYFRPVAGDDPLLVQTANPASFRSVQPPSVYPGSDVVRDCGAAPIYAFYVDGRRPYFYQVWRAPEYRVNQVDVMNGADVKNFSVTSLTSATDSHIRFDIGYKLGTTTCRLILNQTLL